eukprot:m51a1_g3527 hypothetical protein (395) ;mRNA; f:934289-936057
MAAISDGSLRVYYERVFPHETLFEWYSGGSAEYAACRELAFQFVPAGVSVATAAVTGDTVFKRYICFGSAEEMRKEVVAKCPLRIEIGPVYSHSPKIRDSVPTFHATERDLCFDIDMDAYDDVRTCCKKEAICERCWPLVAAAVKVISHALRHCFGFKNLLWVFSGRRGIHCWVSDDRARKLANEAREAIVNFLTISKGGSEASQRVALRMPLYPELQWAYAHVLLPFFENQLLPSQRFLEEEQSVQQFVAFFPEALRKDLADLLAKVDTPEAKWTTLKNFSEKRRGKGISGDPVVNIVMAFTYPRLDANVTKARNHLLKSPFCIHPSTGRVCVPIAEAEIDAFNPKETPTLSSVLQEINDWTGDKSAPDWQKTSLAQSIAVIQGMCVKQERRQ